MDKQLLANMIWMAQIAHKNQFDKSGEPYILHCLKVMHYLKTDDEELQCIAVGHDMLEDSTIYVYEDIKFIFGKRIADGMEALKKDCDYETYKEKVKSNKDAILVKMADLRHNSDIRRLKGLRQKDFDRTVRYMQFYEELKALV